VLNIVQALLLGSSRALRFFWAGHRYAGAMGIKMVVADDSLLIRAGVEAVLEDAPDITIVGSAADLEGLLEVVRATKPDILMTDLRMPPTFRDEGIRAAADLRGEFPDMGVLVLTQFSSLDMLERLFADGSERRGYLLKENLATGRQLVEAISTLACGGSYIDPTVVDELHQPTNGAAPQLGDLSTRELEILAELATGKSNHAIADTLFVGLRTVEKHINSIFVALSLLEGPDVNRRVQATLIYLHSRRANAE
jgi:DNA-binding NarL/FixJ family response regulator